MTGADHTQSAERDPEFLELCLKVLVAQGAGLRFHVALMALVVATIAAQVYPWWQALAWAGMAVAIRELRAWRVQRLVQVSDEPVQQRIRRVMLWNGALGTANGLAALFMLGLPPEADAVMTLLLLSWAAAGVTTNATILAAFRAYVVPIVGLTGLVWVLHGDLVSVGAGALALLFFATQDKLARRNHATFLESFEMRRVNLDLTRNLETERSRLLQAKDAAEQANRAKSRFLASASHDLRQPMQALAFNSAELQHQPLPIPAQALAQDIAASVDALRTMLDGLLELSQLDAQEREPQQRRVDMRRMLDALVASFRATAAAKSLTLRLDCPAGCAINTDPDLMLRVLTNLTDNALKYTLAGEVAIVVHAASHGLQIQVHDTGIGIDAADQERIFDELVQLANHQRDPRQGYGLGLSIVRRLVPMLGMRLTLDSARGRGSVFTLHVPPDRMLPGLASPPPRSAAPRRLRKGTRVLVVDDDADVLRAYGRIVSRHGGVFDGVQSSQAASARAERGDIDVLVADYRLPGLMDGLALIAAARQAQPDLPAVLCTADRTPELDSVCRERQIALLYKPLDEGQLLDAMAAQRAELMTHGD